MALKTDVLKDRLREAFGSDSQETIGNKLNMTQGNISKLLSGSQQPTLETVYHIAEIYDVSVDWLLGLSEKKGTDKSAGKTTYSTAVKAVVQLKNHGAVVSWGMKGQGTHVQSSDPLLLWLVKKALTLEDTDFGSYQRWQEEKLSMFEDKPLLYTDGWHDQTVGFLAREATTESNWLEVYNAAKKAEDRFAEMMGDDPGPFSD